jgi:hypothetical protein
MIPVAVIAGGALLIKAERIRHNININSCSGWRERPKFTAAGRIYQPFVAKARWVANRGSEFVCQFYCLFSVP